MIRYRDEIVITCNFTDRTEHVKFSKEHVRKTEEQIATATLVGFSYDRLVFPSHAPHIKAIRTRRMKSGSYCFFTRISSAFFYPLFSCLPKRKAALEIGNQFF